MRAMRRNALIGTTAPLTRAIVLLAIAFAIAVPSIALARATDAHATVRQCGAVQGNVGVTSQGPVSCAKARQIANAWLKGDKNPTGFACHRKKTGAGSGFQGICINGAKRVTIVPE